MQTNLSVWLDSSNIHFQKKVSNKMKKNKERNTKKRNNKKNKK